MRTRIRNTTKRVVNRTLEIPASVPWRRSAKRVHWFSDWNEQLDEALDALPEQSSCDHATWRSLVQPTAIRKRHAIVTEGDELLAVVSLRRRQLYWEPVSEHCIPFALAPAVPGRLGDAIAALGVEVRCSSLDCVDGLSPSDVRQFTTYGVDLRQDYEEHWKMTSLWKSVRRARNKTSEMTTRVGDAHDVDWVIRNWAERWRGNKLEIGNAAGDRHTSWRHLNDHGRLLVVGLLDRGETVAGRVAVANGPHLFDQCLGRDDSHPNRYIGTRIDDEGYSTAATCGYQSIDLSGYHDAYKSRWAPARGMRYSVRFQPRWRRSTT